jgi:hypothetical protein
LAIAEASGFSGRPVVERSPVRTPLKDRSQPLGEPFREKDLLKLTEVEAFETEVGEIETLTLLMDLASAPVPGRASPEDPKSFICPSAVDEAPNARLLLAFPSALSEPRVTFQGVVHSAVGTANVFDGNNSEQIAPSPISPRSHSFNGVLVGRNP